MRVSFRFCSAALAAALRRASSRAAASPSSALVEMSSSCPSRGGSGCRTSGGGGGEGGGGVCSLSEADRDLVREDFRDWDGVRDVNPECDEEMFLPDEHA
eukprot:369125-Pleurochrysis_carterae.AAC.2